MESEDQHGLTQGYEAAREEKDSHTRQHLCRTEPKPVAREVAWLGGEGPIVSCLMLSVLCDRGRAGWGWSMVVLKR